MEARRRWALVLANYPKTVEVVESGKDGFTTEEECREQAAPFLGDWFAGHMNS